MQLVAGMAEHNEIGAEFGTEAFVGPVVNLELGRVRQVERAAVAGRKQCESPRSPPLRRPEVERVRHLTKLGETLGVNRRAGGGCRNAVRPYQSPDAPTRILHESVAFQIRERPREVVIDQSRVLLLSTLGCPGFQLTTAEIPIVQRAVTDCVAASLAAKRL
jgi:hypothetical protein